MRRSPPDADLVEVPEQVAGILVDAIRTGARELVLPVAAREEPDAYAMHASRREQVPDAVADHDRVRGLGTETARGCDEEVGVGLGVADEVARHDGDALGDAQHGERRRRRLAAAAGGDRPPDAERGQVREELARARQGAHPPGEPAVRLDVRPLEALAQLGGDLSAGLAHQGLREESTAHADLAVDSPYSQLH